MAEASSGPGQNEHDAQHEVRERLETAVGAAKEIGIPLEPIERAIYWWKHFGLKSALSFFIVVLLPIVNSECRAKAGEHMVSAYAQYHDVELEVGSWSGEFFGGDAQAHHVVLKGRGPFAKSELFTADTVTFDLSVWRWLKFNAFRWPWHWKAGDVLRSIQVDRPQIYAERTMAGQWNWDEVLEPEDESSERHESGSALPVGLPHLELKNMRIQWVEQMPTPSGSGIIGASTFTIFLEDVDARLDNINMERDGEKLPVNFAVDGRTSDGRFSVKGKAQFGDIAPRLIATIVLQNIGAAAFGRMLISSALVPTAGTMDGRIELDARYPTLNCRTNVSLRNVTYALNPTAPLAVTSRAQVEKELAALQVNRGVLASCDSDLSKPDFRLIPVVQTAVTQQALMDASPAIRQVAASDSRSIKDKVIDSAVKSAGDAAAIQAGNLVSKLLGVQPRPQPAAQNGFATPPPPPPGAQPAQKPAANPFKSMGDGIKKLFGGGKKDKKK